VSAFSDFSKTSLMYGFEPIANFHLSNTQGLMFQRFCDEVETQRLEEQQEQNHNFGKMEGRIERDPRSSANAVEGRWCMFLEIVNEFNEGIMNIFLCSYINDGNSPFNVFPKEIVACILNKSVETNPLLFWRFSRGFNHYIQCKEHIAFQDETARLKESYRSQEENEEYCTLF
jgi:hypothetical protein